MRREESVRVRLLQLPTVLVLAASGACFSSHSEPGDDAVVDGRDVPREDGSSDGVGPGWYDLAVVEQTGILRVDIVVLVDDSSTMGEEQAPMTLHFPELITELVDPQDRDGDTRIDHPPVEDLNIAVISPDMGTAGFAVPSCANPVGGDGGCFQHAGSAPIGGCETSYPSFLSRNATNSATYRPTMMANDFACIGTLGTLGCEFEQPLKAMRQALSVNALPGGCNAGFLRRDSFLALFFISDEDECSIRDDHPEMFDMSRTDLGEMSFRCFLHPDYLEDLADYLLFFRSLREDDPEMLSIGMIVGVPQDAPACIGAGDELEGCLGIPEMEERIDPAYPDELVPSCNTVRGLAFPARRFVALAQAFGRDAHVDSICKEDWRDAIRGITDHLAESFPSVCLPAVPPFDAPECRSSCALLEILSDDRACEEDPDCPSAWCPAAGEADALVPPPCRDPMRLTTCEPLKRALGLVTASDGSLRRLCLVRQAERSADVDRCSVPSTEGWYYVRPGEGAAGCPELLFGTLSGEFGSLLRPGSTGIFRCPE
jgi:hypothetical protein